MTSQGSAYTRFRRAIEAGNAMAAWAAATELPTVSLPDAIALCLAQLRADAARYDRAAVRLVARLCRELPGLALAEAQLAAAALAALPGHGRDAAAQGLTELLEAH